MSSGKGDMQRVLSLSIIGVTDMTASGFASAIAVLTRRWLLTALSFAQHRPSSGVCFFLHSCSEVGP